MNYIDERNSLGLSYTLGENEFTDIAFEEFTKTHLGELEVEDFFLGIENDPNVKQYESKYKDGDCPEPPADYDLEKEG